MIETPQVVTIPATPYAAVRVTVARAQIAEVMGPAIRSVYAAVAAQGLTPAGPWFTHHFCRPTDTFDFEACVPVSGEVQAEGEVYGGTWRAGLVARTIYHGDYAGLPEAWGEFMEWVESQAFTVAGEIWERYLVGPETTPDAAQWRTELNRPLQAS